MLQSRPESSLSQNTGDDTRVTGAVRRASHASAASEVQPQQPGQSDQTVDPASITSRFANRLARATTAAERPAPLATSRSGRNLASIASVSDTALTSSESYADSSPTPSLDGTPTPAPRNAPKDGVFKEPTALTSALHANRTATGVVAVDNAPQRERAQPRQEQPARHASTRPTSAAPSVTNDREPSRSRAVSVMSRASSRMSDLDDAFGGSNEPPKPTSTETGSMSLNASRGTLDASGRAAVPGAGAMAGPEGANSSTINREFVITPIIEISKS